MMVFGGRAVIDGGKTFFGGPGPNGDWEPIMFSCTCDYPMINHCLFVIVCFLQLENVGVSIYIYIYIYKY